MKTSLNRAALILIPCNVDLETIAPPLPHERIAAWRQKFDALPEEMKIGDAKPALPKAEPEPVDLYEWSNV